MYGHIFDLLSTCSGSDVVMQAQMFCFNCLGVQLTMFTVKETPYFQREAAKVWGDSERSEFIGWIADNPLAGDVIPGAGPLRKVRWARQGMGKSGGVRVIYFNQLDAGLIELLTVYSKSVDDNLSAAFLRRLMSTEGWKND